jgi:hypothetical protein
MNTKMQNVKSLRNFNKLNEYTLWIVKKNY